ncbi:MAG: hypothetical protein HY956_06380 [Deltaproteobacteria bacterium]|nr:hypothetical protein [Deltaproteobacteria bacterium]
MSASTPQNDAGIADYLRVVWKRRTVVALFFAAGTLISAASTLFMTDIYRASAVITPVGGKDTGGSEMSMVAQQLGGLSGITFPASRPSSEIISLLNSNILREKVIESHNLLPVLFSDSWDGERMRWKDVQKGGLSGQINKVFSTQAAGASDAVNSGPTLWDGLRELDGIVKVSASAKDNTIAIYAEHRDPAFASRLIELFLSTLNHHMSGEAKRVAQTNKRYLLEQLGASNDPFIRQKIYNLIAQQIEVYMMSEVKENFAFKVIDPPRVPDRRLRPAKTRFVEAGAALALLCGIFAAFVIEFASILRGRKKVPAEDASTAELAVDEEAGGG